MLDIDDIVDMLRLGGTDQEQLWSDARDARLAVFGANEVVAAAVQILLVLGNKPRDEYAYPKDQGASRDATRTCRNPAN